jgi:hypothetical protein
MCRLQRRAALAAARRSTSRPSAAASRVVVPCRAHAQNRGGGRALMPVAPSQAGARPRAGARCSGSRAPAAVRPQKAWCGDCACVSARATRSVSTPPSRNPSRKPPVHPAPPCSSSQDWRPELDLVRGRLSFFLARYTANSQNESALTLRRVLASSGRGAEPRRGGGSSRSDVGGDASAVAWSRRRSFCRSFNVGVAGRGSSADSGRRVGPRC